jgi:hypothetical protein
VLDVTTAIERDLGSIKGELQNADVDFSKSIDQLMKDSRWYQWGLRSTLRQARGALKTKLMTRITTQVPLGELLVELANSATELSKKAHGA